MADGRQHGLIPALTDQKFDDVYNAMPAQKPSSTEAKKKYVEAKVSYKKRTMRRLFLSPDQHIFDEAISAFRNVGSKRTGTIVKENITKIDTLLNGYSQTLQNLVPVEYEISPQGRSIRDKLREMPPNLRE